MDFYGVPRCKGAKVSQEVREKKYGVSKVEVGGAVIICIYLYMGSM